MGNEHLIEQAYLDAERQDGIAELRGSEEYNAEAVMVVGEEKSLCHTCHALFDPYDMRSPNGEYLESCEARTTSGRSFPKHLPEFAKADPHAFCSADCEQESIDGNALDEIETQRMAECGMFDEVPHLDHTLGSYAS
jgi:hypothetical protein